LRGTTSLLLVLLLLLLLLLVTTEHIEEALELGHNDIEL